MSLHLSVYQSILTENKRHNIACSNPEMLQTWNISCKGFKSNKAMGGPTQIYCATCSYLLVAFTQICKLSS